MWATRHLSHLLSRANAKRFRFLIAFIGQLFRTRSSQYFRPTTGSSPHVGSHVIMTDTCGNDFFALFPHSTVLGSWRTSLLFVANVAELLEYIWERRDLFDRAILAEWLRENEAFYARTRRRVVSYWDCYYRWEHPVFSSYVGSQLIEFFEECGSR